MAMRAGVQMTKPEQKVMLRKRSAKRQLVMIEAVTTLTKAGWNPEKIAYTLRISRATVERYIVDYYRNNLMVGDNNYR